MSNPDKRKKREKRVKKKLARQWHERAARVAEVAANPPPTPNRFTVTYTAPDALARMGPVVRQLQAAGARIPDGFPSRVIGLMGRDLLRFATFT